MEQRAYAQFEVRAVDDAERIIEGIANSASVDSYGTIIEPAGAVFNLPLPLFFHHDRRAPIGEVIASGIRDGKRWFRAKIAKVADDGTEGGRTVKNRVDAAWTDIKHGLVRGTSIEFHQLEPKSSNATRITKWRWLALAVVPVPSNIDASIVNIRSIAESTAASGEKVPASRAPNPTNPRRTMTIQERIQQHENSRAAKVARQQALMDAADTRGETLDPTEAEEYDTLASEVGAIDGHLTRLRELKRANDNAAVPVNGAGASNGSQTRGGVPIVRVRSNVDPGVSWARHVMAFLACNGNRFEAAAYAREKWGDAGAEIETMLRAPVSSLNTTSATAAGPLVVTNYLNEFLELLRPMTLIGRIPGLRRVPFNISMPAQTAGGTYNWVGQGKPKPVTNIQLSTVTLDMAKAAGIIVLTEELVRSSTPSAESVVRDDMLNGMRAFLDTQLVDPTVAAVQGTNPAAITNGVTGTVASGTTEAHARADLRALINTYADANYGLSGLVLLMSESVAFTLGTMVNAVGGPAFPGLTVSGGNILGIPVVTSNVIDDDIFAVHAPSILLADEGGTEISVSREASIEMDSAPEDSYDAETVLVSLWQRNLVGMRVERFINWKKARSSAVQRIHTVAYV